MSERLFRAYFVEGRDIGDQATLSALASEVGLVREAAAAFLASEEGVQEVRAFENEAHRLGINGVPFMILDRRLGVSGAQPPEILVQAIREAAQAGPAADNGG